MIDLFLVSVLPFVRSAEKRPINTEIGTSEGTVEEAPAGIIGETSVPLGGEEGFQHNHTSARRISSPRLLMTPHVSDT